MIEMAVKLTEQELRKVSGGSVASELVRQTKEKQKNTTTNNSNGCDVTVVEKGKDNMTNSNTGVISGSQNNNTIEIN